MIEILKDPVVKYYLSAVLAAWPVWRIYARAGFSGAPVVLLAVPYVGLILCAGLLVFRKWPILAERN